MIYVQPNHFLGSSPLMQVNVHTGKQKVAACLSWTLGAPAHRGPAGDQTGPSISLSLEGSLLTLFTDQCSAQSTVDTLPRLTSALEDKGGQGVSHRESPSQQHLVPCPPPDTASNSPACRRGPETRRVSGGGKDRDIYLNQC